MSRCPVIPSVALAFLASALPAQLTLIKLSGWDKSTYDVDGDGYARADAPNPTNVWSFAAVCKRGDTNDNDAAVHPRRLEVYGNAKDDDCDGLVDEPWVEYFESGMGNDSQSFAMVVHVSDARTMAVRDQVWPQGGLYCRVEYQSLSDTGGSQFKTSKVGTMGVDRSTLVSVEGLTSCTVYRARVQFIQGPNALLTVPVLTPVGPTSAWYYTITDGSDATSRLRAAIVLRALYEYHRSEDLGEVGHVGSAQVDGTAYGADAGSLCVEREAWCSEFYSTLVRWGGVAAMATQSGRDGIADFFASYSAYESYETFAASRTADLTGSARPGDYMRLSGHSAMFLAYDTHASALWTLDGNIGGIAADGQDRRGNNEVMVTDGHSLGSIIGWGRIVAFMLL